MTAPLSLSWNIYQTHNMVWKGGTFLSISVTTPVHYKVPVHSCQFKTRMWVGGGESAFFSAFFQTGRKFEAFFACFSRKTRVQRRAVHAKRNGITARKRYMSTPFEGAWTVTSFQAGLHCNTCPLFSAQLFGDKMRMVYNEYMKTGNASNPKPQHFEKLE